MEDYPIKIEISAPATVNKVKSLEFTLDKSKGKAFRMKKLCISVPSLDAIADGDKVEFQISTQDQSEAAALYDIDSEYEIFTYAKEFKVLGTNGPIMELDIRKAHWTDKCDGIMIVDHKFYLNQLITGQVGAIPMKVTIIGKYVNKVIVDNHRKQQSFS